MTRRTARIARDYYGTLRLKRGWHPEQLGLAKLHVRNGYHAEVCTGEAHGNPHIDHCMSCLGHVWGYRAVADKP